jgi:hypothetical protein
MKFIANLRTGSPLGNRCFSGPCHGGADDWHRTDLFDQGCIAAADSIKKQTATLEQAVRYSSLNAGRRIKSGLH